MNVNLNVKAHSGILILDLPNNLVFLLVKEEIQLIMITKEGQ